MDWIEEIKQKLQEAEDDKYSHVGQGRYKKKSDVGKENTPTFKKEGDRFVKMSAAEAGEDGKKADDKGKAADKKPEPKKAKGDEKPTDKKDTKAKDREQVGSPNFDEESSKVAQMVGDDENINRVVMNRRFGEYDINNFSEWADKTVDEGLPTDGEGNITGPVDDEHVKTFGDPLDGFVEDLLDHRDSFWGKLTKEAVPTEVKQELISRLKKHDRISWQQEHARVLWDVAKMKNDKEALSAATKLLNDAKVATVEDYRDTSNWINDTLQANLDYVDEGDKQEVIWKGPQDEQRKAIETIETQMKSMQDALASLKGEKGGASKEVQDAFKDKPGKKKFDKNNDLVYWVQDGQVMVAPADDPEAIEQVDDEELIKQLNF